MSTLKKLGFAAAAIAVSALAQGPQSFTPHQIKPNVYWLEGGGGNTGVIVGTNGVIIVDAKTTPAFGKMIVDEVAKITPKPITHVIETHSDGDHVNGLASFPTGLTIVAQEGNKKEQDAALAKGGPGAPPADRQPTQVITKTKEAFTFDGEKIELYTGRPLTPAAIWSSFSPLSVSFSGAISFRSRDRIPSSTKPRAELPKAGLKPCRALSNSMPIRSCQVTASCRQGPLSRRD